MATHPTVDRIIHKALVECAVAVDMMSVKHAMHQLVLRTATRHAAQVTAFFDLLKVTQVPPPCAAATLDASVASNQLPPKKRGRKPNALKREDLDDANKENEPLLRYTYEDVLPSSLEEALKVSPNASRSQYGVLT